LITASLPFLVELRSFFLIVVSCVSSSSLSDPSSTAEALTTPAGIFSSVRCANEALQEICIPHKHTAFMYSFSQGSFRYGGLMMAWLMG
jgi:hypothetical protein